MNREKLSLEYKINQGMRKFTEWFSIFTLGKEFSDGRFDSEKKSSEETTNGALPFCPRKK